MGDHLTLTYTRRKPPTDVTYSVEVSDDMFAWTNIGVTEQILADDGTFQIVIATDPAKISESSRRFIHLKVMQP